MTDLVTTKISKESLRMVRIIAGHTGEKQFEVIERLLNAELEKIKKKESKNRG